MDREMPREFRQCRRVSKKRIWLANLIESNWLKLGAGVSVGIASCGLVEGTASAADAHASGGHVRSNPYVSPTSLPASLFANATQGEGQQNAQAKGVAQTSDLQYSELRLKSIGTAVGLVPIGNPRSVTPSVEVSKPNPSKIRVNPMASGPSDLIDQPVVELNQNTPAAVNHPRIVSMRRSGFSSDGQSSTDAAEPVNGPQWGVPSVAQTPVPEPQATAKVAAAETPVPATVTTEHAVGPHRVSNETQARVAAVESTVPEETHEPVMFSFSDFSEPDASDQTPVAEQASAEQQPIDAGPTGFVIPPPPADAFVATAPAANRTPTKTATEILPPLPAPSRQWVASAGSDGSPVKRIQRHRKHVEVAAPPMIPTARREHTGTVSAAPIVPAKLAGFALSKPDAAKQDTKPQKEAVPVPKVTESPLMREIRETHPTARISLAEMKDQVIVRGVCRTREQATEIIRLVRSRFLVPVDDQLVIR
ncbi:MAG: hypothetical protein ACF8CQ_20635 [Rhodopirellula sp. JB044]|uniref:hypothetical protein n=1 Tax=Rhodopirellula sp. JB044 TaxID=3342844 RepID=UPI00370AB826